MSWIWLCLASGFAALVYQVLWVKQITSIYGATSFSVSITLVAFFLGLSTGSFLWGKWSLKFSSPFKALAVIELGIAIGNVLIYFLAPYLEWTSVYLQTSDGHTRFHLFVISTLVLCLLFPTAFFLGGTYPVMVQAFSQKSPKPLGTAIYGLNTAGACLGALMGGTTLPLVLGYKGTGLMALAITGSVILLSWALSFQTSSTRMETSATPSKIRNKKDISPTMWALCFISGFSSLGLEVVWTHMFAQVLQNSVYSFACILTLFLLTQALGAGLITLWTRKNDISDLQLGFLISTISVTVLTTPFIFHWVTKGITYLGVSKGLSFSSYLLDALLHIGIVLFIPSLAMGCLFPTLIHWCSREKHRLGKDLGKCISINTLGAILGSIATGFFLISYLGTWSTIRILACLYALLLIIPGITKTSFEKPIIAYFGVGVFLLSITLLDATRLPLVKVMKGDGEVLLHVEEDEEGVVAVVEKRGHRNIVVNNSYTLGGTRSAKMEAFQSHLPLALHPNPKSVFYLGMGTGITAGASLKHPIENVVITELVGNSIHASKEFFTKWNGGIFQDNRVKIIHGDGRQILKHSAEFHDVIIADLFVPWKRGTGSLYTLEHFQHVYSRLNSNGIFAQWLPLYQVTKKDFDIISKTMQQAFPQITVWRGDFYSNRPILCLIGHKEKTSFTSSIFSQPTNRFHPPFLRNKLHRQHPITGALFKHYLGELKHDPTQLSFESMNSENLPIVEFMAPIHHRQVEAGLENWFHKKDYLNWMESFLPKRKNDHFIGGNSKLISFADVGLAHHRMKILEHSSDEKEQDSARREYQKAMTQSLH